MIAVRPVLALGFCIAATAPSLAALIVVRASGPSASSFPAGAILDDQQAVSLKRGDRLTLLDGSGTRVLVGPRAGKLTMAASGPAAQARGTVDELQQIFSRARERRAVLGASRGFSMPPDFSRPLPLSLWTINIQKGGNWCVPAHGAVSLAREDVRLPIMLDLRTTGQNIRVTWQKGVKEALLPVVSQGPATLFADNKPIGQFVIHIISASDGEIVGLAQQLLENECYNQIDLIQSVTG